MTTVLDSSVDQRGQSDSGNGTGLATKPNSMKGHYKASKLFKSGLNRLAIEYTAPILKFRVVVDQDVKTGEFVITQFLEHGKKHAELDQTHEIYRGTDEAVAKQIMEQKYGTTESFPPKTELS